VTQPGPRFRVVGSKGVFTKSGIDVQEAQLASGVRPGDRGWAVEDEAQDGIVTTEAGSRFVRSLPGRYEHYYQQLRRALLYGEDVPVNASEGVYVLRIIEAARQSASQAEIVTLD
jgi:predicted dehydrogenase